ncbi:MAG TPA: hypothetical protein VJ654_03070 [Noviherbaspirillum sp.]|nr:hypothetical protein [Noviherbaspirillum sp.]
MTDDVAPLNSTIHTAVNRIIDFTVIGVDGAVLRRGRCHEEDMQHQAFGGETVELGHREVVHSEPVPSWQESRRRGYPPLEELADALFWQGQGDNTKMDSYLAKCAAVKQQIPKPE